jgi:hypothetical protein
MKTIHFHKIKKSFLFLILISVIFTFSCDKKIERCCGEEISHRLYLTKGDYFNFVNTWGDDNGPFGLNISDPRIAIVGDDTICPVRWRLEGGYVYSALESSYGDFFTDITFAEFVSYYERNKPHSFPLDSFFERVIDKDPFLEYYLDTARIFDYPDDNIEVVNEIIRNGELEKYFKRVK